MKKSLLQLLSQRKTTKARLEKELASAKFVSITIGTSGKVNGVSVADVEKRIVGAYDKINSLISDLEKLNKVITAANSGVSDETTNVKTTRMDTLDRNCTLADIIQLKGTMKYRHALVDNMRGQLAKALTTIEVSQGAINDRCDAMISAMKNGNENATVTDVNIAMLTKTFHENNDYKLVDPLKLTDLLVTLTDKFDNIDIEIDSKNSELNALTIIEID